jgi:outer membrane murein-binding lipoprotein Lpp
MTMLMRRRVGRALVAGAVVGGVAHHAGRVSAENDMREQQQSAQIADLQAQQEQMMTQQQMAQQPQYAPPPQPQYAPPPQPQYAPPPPPQYAPVEAPPPAPPAAAPAPAQPDRIAQLKELGELKAAGVLTEEEFQAEKAKILSS